MADVEIDSGKLQTESMRQLETFTTGFVRTAAATAREIAPERTAHLKSRIGAQPVRRVGPWSLESGIESRADYSLFVHEPTRPHVIRPRRAKALRFFWPKVGRVVFLQHVNHPGTKGQPFLRNAVHRTASADPRIRLGE